MAEAAVEAGGWGAEAAVGRLRGSSRMEQLDSLADKAIGVRKVLPTVCRGDRSMRDNDIEIGQQEELLRRAVGGRR